MGPCQGRYCHLGSIRLYAREQGTDEAAIGTTTARPPWAPVSLGLLAGRPHEPAKRTALHHRHVEAGAEVIWTGAWQRPHNYGDAPAEAAERARRGRRDRRLHARQAARRRARTRRRSSSASTRTASPTSRSGRVRYGVLSTDAGRIMDDGTIGRLGDEQFYVTTTSTGADGVLGWFEWWNAVWRMDVEIVNVTGALAAVNVAGPRSRELLAAAHRRRRLERVA